MAAGIFPGPLSRLGSEGGEGGARLLQSCLLGPRLNGIDHDASIKNGGQALGDDDAEG